MRLGLGLRLHGRGGGAAAPGLFDHEILNESGTSTIIAVDGLRVRINGGSWQDLPTAGLTVSRTAADELTVSGFAGTETSIEWHYEQEQPDEPYSAPNAIDALYVAHATSGVTPQNPSLPGVALSPTIAGTPVETTA